MTEKLIPMSSKAFTKVHKRVEILDQVIEGKITEIQAWIELWTKERQIRNLLKQYKQFWEKWLIHRLIWRQSNHHIKESKKIIIIDVIKQDDFKGCKPIFIN